MDDREEIKKAVRESFLSKKDKDILIQKLNTPGLTMDFYKLFDDFLIKEIDRKTDTAISRVEAYDKDCEELENKYSNLKKVLEKGLKDRLSNLETPDFVSREKIFSEHHESVENLLVKEEKELKALNAKHLAPTIEEKYAVSE